LEEFVEAAEPTFFYSCLWECTLACVSIRLPAFIFANSHFTKKKSMEDQIYFMGSNIDVLIQALCSSVQDSSVLVQRSALDFLLIGFPLHNSQLTRPDMIKVITATIKVVLRRDMSLNRRLYGWVLGTDANGQPLQFPQPAELGSLYPSAANPARHQRQDSISTINSETELGYFNVYSRENLILGIKGCILESAEGDSVAEGKPINLRPFRILISLLDKQKSVPPSWKTSSLTRSGICTRSVRPLMTSTKTLMPYRGHPRLYTRTARDTIDKGRRRKC
jgi:hypothetical protein